MLVTEAKAPVVPRPLTHSERTKIRDLLEVNFDWNRGAYLNGFTDQKIATDLNVPRIHVENIRETAYGPIKVSPEFVKFQTELEQLTKQSQAIIEQITGLNSRFLAFQKEKTAP